MTSGLRRARSRRREHANGCDRSVRLVSDTVQAVAEDTQYLKGQGLSPRLWRMTDVTFLSRAPAAPCVGRCVDGLEVCRARCGR